MTERMVTSDPSMRNVTCDQGLVFFPGDPNNKLCRNFCGCVESDPCNLQEFGPFVYYQQVESGKTTMVGLPVKNWDFFLVFMKIRDFFLVLIHEQGWHRVDRDVDNLNCGKFDVII